MDKPTKPTNLMPRSFGGVKNNWSASMQSTGYEDGVPAIYGGDNLNYQLDATGKELDYCEKICDYINAIPINKTPIVDANNKLVYTQYDIRVYNATETYYENDYLSGFVNGEKHIYRCKQNGVIGQSLSDDTYFERVDIMGNVKTIGRNIGEIITSSLPLTDAGLHLLDGTRLSGDGIYGEFVDYIADLYTENPTANYWTTESDWQTSVTTYGVCGKFVYDSVNNTVRLPKVTGIIEGTVDLTALGDLVEAGLPDHSHTYNTKSSTMPQSGNATQCWTGDATGTTSNASASNPIYGNSTTVQPQTIKAFCYIVIATSTKTDIQVDIDEIATDLNGKVDKSDLVEVQCVVETYVNGTSWYRVYSDGWCEQGGRCSSGTGVQYLKSFKDTNYSLMVTKYGQSSSFERSDTGITAYSATGFTFTTSGNVAGNHFFFACGYIN